MTCFLKEFKLYSEKKNLPLTLNNLLNYINLKGGNGNKVKEAQQVNDVELNNSIESLNNSFGEFFIGDNNRDKVNSVASSSKQIQQVPKQKSKYLKQSNKLNLQPATIPAYGNHGQSGSGLNTEYVSNNGHANKNGGKYHNNKPPRVDSEDKENIKVEVKKNYAEVARKSSTNHSKGADENNKN